LKADSQKNLDEFNKSVGATLDQNLSQEHASTDHFSNIYSQQVSAKYKDQLSVKNFNEDVITLPELQHTNSEPNTPVAGALKGLNTINNTRQNINIIKEQFIASENKIDSQIKDKYLSSTNEMDTEDKIVYEHTGQYSFNMTNNNTVNLDNDNTPHMDSTKLNAVYKHKEKGSFATTKHYASGIFMNPSVTSQQMKTDTVFQNLICKGIFCKLKEGHNSINKYHDFNRNAYNNVHSN